jgi:cellulose biosynthesis protein BcsQ
MNRYVVWNNKGGVGKSTIVFNLASRYADLNPTSKVLVLDLCPQANCTMMFLGGGETGEDHLLSFQAASQTVVGYIGDLVQRMSGASRVPSRVYHARVRDYNPQLPANLWLVPGDGNLELVAPAISYYANAQIPNDAWRNVHLWIRMLVESITEGDEDWTVFIDTNPSFAIHTELAVAAGNRLLVPFRADDSSRVATKALFALLHGSEPPHPVYSRYTFAAKAREAGLELPLCHLFIGNQFTQYRGSATAFSAMSDAVMRVLYDLYVSHPERYTDYGPLGTQSDFRAHFVYELRDFNSAGVVAAHEGRMLSDLHETTYSVHGREVRLDTGRIRECRESIDKIVEGL